MISLMRDSASISLGSRVLRQLLGKTSGCISVRLNLFGITGAATRYPEQRGKSG